MATPVKIKVNKQESLYIKWNDGSEHNIPLKFIRDESPDAQNKGENILWRHIPPPPKGPDKPGKYEVENIEMVGNYAIQIKWKDGYDYGIFPWNMLQQWGDYWDIKDSLPESFEHKHNH